MLDVHCWQIAKGYLSSRRDIVSNSQPTTQVEKRVGLVDQDGGHANSVRARFGSSRKVQH